MYDPQLIDDVEGIHARIIRGSVDLGRVGDLIPWWDDWIRRFPKFVILRNTPVIGFVYGLIRAYPVIIELLNNYQDCCIG